LSYSFNVRAATKALVKKLVADEFDKVVGNMICHAKDRRQAEAATSAFIDLLDDDASKDVLVAVHGGLSGHWVKDDLTVVTGSNVSISAAYTTKA